MQHGAWDVLLHDIVRNRHVLGDLDLFRNLDF